MVGNSQAPSVHGHLVASPPGTLARRGHQIQIISREAKGPSSGHLLGREKRALGRQWLLVGSTALVARLNCLFACSLGFFFQGRVAPRRLAECFSHCDDQAFAARFAKRCGFMSCFSIMRATEAIPGILGIQIRRPVFRFPPCRTREHQATGAKDTNERQEGNLRHGERLTASTCRGDVIEWSWTRM